MGYFYSEKGDNTSQAEGPIHDQNAMAFIILQLLLNDSQKAGRWCFLSPLALHLFNYFNLVFVILILCPDLIQNLDPKKISKCPIQY